MATFVERMIGAATLNAATYEEIERDVNALPQAMGVVALSVVASGIGSAGAGGIRGIFFGVITALVGWLIWAGIIYLIGTKVLAEPQTKADFPEVARTIGFAAAPGILSVFGILPFLGILIRLVIALWQLAATVVAVRQVLDYTSTAKAVVVCVVGFIAYVVAMTVASAFGLAGLGMGAMF